MDLKLKGKTAFISGSTAGIGFAAAKRLLEEGAAVIVNGRSHEGVSKAIDELKKQTGSNEISGIAADFSKSAAVDALLKQ